MKLALFVSVLFGCVAAVEDASDASGSIGGKEEEQVACSFKEKGASSFVSQGAEPSAGLHGGDLPEQDAGRLVAANEDQVFDILEEIQEGKYAGKKLKKISKTWSFGLHEFVFGKGDAGDEGAVVTFDFAKISAKNKTRINDGELDLGKIRYLNLYRNAVEVLPMLEIHEDNGIGMLNLCCDTLSELGSLLERENKIFIGVVYRVWLRGYAINLLTKMETQEGNEMKTLTILCGSLSKIEPLLESKEKIHLGKTKGPVFIYCWDDKTKEKIREILETRNNVLGSGETGKAIGNQIPEKMHQSISGAWQR
ncbi:MAG: uncharacterized protein A8A55_2479 [Amphiamblys sp. WSBS2006]|nr:MAG: uncharacterized protein A8A55_2479 [Amphiamblys sp. WSBS2006]